MLDLYILKFSPCPFFWISAGRKRPFITFGSCMGSCLQLYLPSALPMSVHWEQGCPFLFWLIHTHQAAKWGFCNEARPIQPQYQWIETSPLNFCLPSPNLISSHLYILHNTIYKSTVKPTLNPCLSLELLNPKILPLGISCYNMYAVLGPLFLKCFINMKPPFWCGCKIKHKHALFATTFWLAEIPF